MTVPTIGRIVHYTLSKQDADEINRRRKDAKLHRAEHIEASSGVQVHVGNDVREGDVYPLIITRVWGSTPESAINGQVALDGNDLFWVSSAAVGTGPHTFAWPTRN